MFTAALFTFAKTWKQPRCPSVGEWIIKHPDDKILLSTERNELSSHKKAQKKLKCVLLNKGSQCEKPTYYMTPTI